MAGAEAFRRMGDAGAAQGRGAGWPSDAALVQRCHGGKRGGNAGAGARSRGAGRKEPKGDFDSDIISQVISCVLE